MINIPNIDSLIWDIQTRTAEIAKEMSTEQQVCIALNGEGPCAKTLGLYDLLDDLCNKFNFDKQKITIVTCNQVETHDEYQINKMPPLYIKETQEFISKNQHNAKLFNDDFKTFGLFIGRSNYHRLWLTSVLYGQHRDQSLITFHYDNRDDFHRYHLGFDRMMQYRPTVKLIDQAIELIKHSPLTVDNQIETYPMISPAHLNIAKLYHKFFVEIVCETYYTGNTFYPTEKIWRPLALKTPFIIQGPTNYYNNLRKLGFKTFHQYWDEGYGEDPNDYQPTVILETVQRLSKLSVQELKDMHTDMQPILDHNYECFMNLNSNDFKKIWAY